MMVGRGRLVAAALSLLAVGLVCVSLRQAGHHGAGVSLAETELEMYPVDERAMKQFLSHTEGSHALLDGTSAGAAAASAAGGGREESIGAFIGAKGERAAAAAHRLGAKRFGAGQRGLVLFLSSSGQPSRLRAQAHAPAQMHVVPQDALQKLSQDSRLYAKAPAAQPLDQSAMLYEGPSADRKSARGSRGRGTTTALSGPPCVGPVRHTDSPGCVARKAMAQALQAEEDAQSVDKEIVGHKQDNKKFDRWESKTHSEVSSEMDAGFGKLKKMLRRDGRRVNSQDRRIEIGDQTSLGKASAFTMREAKDMAQVGQRITQMEIQAKEISKMRGPPGPPGPRGYKGHQGVRGPQGERGPEGDMGPQGETGSRGYNGMSGSNGHRGPAGHFLRLKGKLGKQSTKVDQKRLRMFADSLRNMEQMVHRMGALRKAPTPNPRP